MPRTNFYFGRLNFKHQLTSLDDFNQDLDREERVRQALWNYATTDGVVFEERDGDVQWVFGVTQQENGDIVGKFGKIYPDRPTTYDFDQGDFIEEGEESHQADYSMFLIHPSENLIIFNQRQHIGYRQFQEAFAGGYNNFIGLDDALKITLLQDVEDVYRLLEEATVKYVNFDLVPTNPTSDPDMQILDERIQNMAAEQFGMTAESDSEINMDDDLMQAALNMANAGYGNWEMDAEREDRREHYRSTDRPAAHESRRPSTINDLGGLSTELLERARSLLSDNE